MMYRRAEDTEVTNYFCLAGSYQIFFWPRNFFAQIKDIPKIVFCFLFIESIVCVCSSDIEPSGLYLAYYLFTRAVPDKAPLIEESFLETNGLLATIATPTDIVHCNNGKIFIQRDYLYSEDIILSISFVYDVDAPKNRLGST